MNFKEPSLNSEELKKQVLDLAAEKAKLEQERLEFKKSQKIGVTAIVSIAAVIISALQFWVSKEQRSLSEAQTIQQYIPHLLNPESRDMVLELLNEYIDDKTIIKIAARYKATPTLKGLAQSQDEDTRKIANQKITSIESERNSLVKSLFSDEKVERIEAASEIINKWSSDVGLVTSLISYASKNLKNDDGIYNTVVVMNSLPKTSLAANAKDLEEFLSQAEKIGPKTKLMVKKVRQKIEI